MANFSFDVEKHPKPQVLVVHLKGYVDQAAGEAMEEKMKKLLEGGKTQVLFCFKDVLIINSAGVSSLISIIEMIQYDFQGKLSFCCLPKMVVDVFQLVGILQSHTVFQSHKEAIDLVGSSD